MLQTGHGGYESIPNTVDKVRAAVARAPHMPVVDGEVCYEGIVEASRQEIQRFMFWACMLSGAAGHTYGANGIWQVNRAEQPYGPSPHGTSWGDTPWKEAYRLPGSTQSAWASGCWSATTGGASSRTRSGSSRARRHGLLLAPTPPASPARCA